MDVPDELVEAFAAAVPLALRELAGVEAVVREEVSGEADRFAGVSAVIRLTAADGVGRVILSVPERTAAAVARRMLAGTAYETSADLVGDCVGEVANVAAGQAKALLVGSPAHFTLSTPTVHSGRPEGVTDGSRVIQFDSDVGEFVVYLGPPS